MHFLGGVRKWIVAVVALLIIVPNISIVSLEASAAEAALTKEQEEFVAKYYEICLNDAVSYNLAWQTPMAQAIVESQSGTSGLSVKYHNFHGITSKKGGYKHFASDEDGWLGYFKNLEVTPVYSENGVFETGDDPYKMLDALVESGYAEDENYRKVIGIYIKFIEKWREANSLPTSGEHAEKMEEMERDNREAVTNLAPQNGCAGISQMLHEITPLPQEVADFKEKNNETNDPNNRKLSGTTCRSFSCYNTLMEILLIILAVLNLGLIIFLIIQSNSSAKVEMPRELDERLIRIESELDKLAPKISSEFRENRKEITTGLAASRKELSDNLQTIQKTVDVRVKSLQDENTKKLEEMRETVDEKLKASVEKRFNESFKTISGQLTQVYQGLGEMKNLATGVGDLKKVMEGVKTRGIYGEVQLGSIVSDILNNSQYEENIATKKGSADRVEFAIKMPGKDEDSTIYLPIDSKFPVENYSRLLAAYDNGDKTEIERFSKALATDVKEQAKKISTKYLDPPATTDFGIMFVPTESLYAEILRIPGLSDEIRTKFHVSITSPSTLPVALNGLLMGFKSVAIEKRSSEVWQVLGAVKSQFGKFGDLLDATHKKLMESANKIESAATTSRQIERKLKNVEALPESDSTKLIGKIDVE